MFHIHVVQVPLAFFHSFLKLLAVTDDAAFYHFTQQVVAFSGTFAHAGEHGEAVVPFGDVVDQLHDEHRLADNLPALAETDLRSIHQPAPEFDDLTIGTEILTTGIKVIDLLEPYSKGGKIGLFGGSTWSIRRRGNVHLNHMMMPLSAMALPMNHITDGI